jgi:hypothetical protein
VLYRSYRPGPPLNEFIDNFWLIEGGQAPRLEKILPCGTSELVVNLKNDEIHIHNPEQPERHRRFSGAVVSGTYSQSFICNALQHEAIIGVHFKAGGAFPFLRTTASELTNAHVNLDDLWVCFVVIVIGGYMSHTAKPSWSQVRGAGVCNCRCLSRLQTRATRFCQTSTAKASTR